MFRLTNPSDDEVRRFISEQEKSTFSYPEVGTSAGKLPGGYNKDHNRVLLGKGPATWNRAVSAIRRWEMFAIAGIHFYWPTSVIEPGTTVAIGVRHFGFYSLNACRVVYLIDENEAIRRFGFAYGTLVEHAESGEERFSVEWNRANDEVWYDLLAFSRPHKLLAKVGYPLSRRLQKEFARGSKLAMVNATKG